MTSLIFRDERNKNSDDRFSDLYVAFVIALSLHMLFFFILIFSETIKEKLASIFPLQSTNNPAPVLIDLKDYEEEELKEHTPFVSQKNRNLQGKLTKDKGINIREAIKDKETGEENTEAQQNAKASIKSVKIDGTEGSTQQDDFTIMLIDETATDANNSDSATQSAQAEKSSSSAPKKRSRKASPYNSPNASSAVLNNLRFQSRIDTKDIQIGSKKIPYAKFHLELINILKNRFFTLLRSNPQANTYFVDTGRATVRAQIDKNGTISFLQLVEGNTTQPYLNYLGEKIVDNPGIIQKVPEEFFADAINNKVLLLNLTVIFTGHPTRQWWFSWYFENVVEKK